jgi:hypothetical protein
MATTTTISEQEYRELALNDTDLLWELWDGVLVEKPLMSMRHDNVASYLGAALIVQLDYNVYRVNVNGGKTPRLSAARRFRNLVLPPLRAHPDCLAQATGWLLPRVPLYGRHRPHPLPLRRGH